jgi:flagellar motility protein MotE (MotC chaperone)
MTSSVALYEALTSAPDERTRARVIAEAFERLEERYPHLPDLVTQGHLRESELRLKKDIEQVRAELRETELRLKKDIEQLRAELKKDIEQVRADLSKDIEHVRGEIARAKVDMLKWMVPLMFGQVAVIAALVKIL